MPAFAMQSMLRGNRKDNTEKTRSEGTLVEQVSLRFELEDPLVMLCHASQYNSTLPYPSWGKMLLTT